MRHCPPLAMALSYGVDWHPSRPLRCHFSRSPSPVTHEVEYGGIAKIGTGRAGCNPIALNAEQSVLTVTEWVADIDLRITIHAGTAAERL
jgi:hypothetical protein